MCPNSLSDVVKAGVLGGGCLKDTLANKAAQEICCRHGYKYCFKSFHW